MVRRAELLCALQVSVVIFGRLEDGAASPSPEAHAQNRPRQGGGARPEKNAQPPPPKHLFAGHIDTFVGRMPNTFACSPTVPLAEKL